MINSPNFTSILAKRGLSPAFETAAWLMVLFTVLAAGQRNVSHDADELRSDLQQESFSSLSWTLAEFKVTFGQKFEELLLALQQARKQAESGAKPRLDPNELAEVLEDAILQAKRAVPVEEMQECLLNFYRAARLTNKFVSLYSEVQGRNSNRVSFATEKSFLEAISTHSNISAKPARMEAR